MNVERPDPRAVTGSVKPDGKTAAGQASPAGSAVKPAGAATKPAGAATKPVGAGAKNSPSPAGKPATGAAPSRPSPARPARPPAAPLWPRIRPYWELMRWHRPVGVFLLLWPVLWALWLAADGVPPLSTLLVFVLGTALMRACGCVINDIADRKFDGHVERTRGRPLATGALSLRQAWATFAVTGLLAFLLVLTQNRATVLLSFGGLALTSLYPFMKRHTYFPQVVLGAAFAWAIPMAFMAVSEQLPPLAWLLYVSTLLWVLAYDTLYGMVDRADDLKIGVKSTAILFGEADRHMVGIIHALALAGLLLVGVESGRGSFYFAGLALAALNVVWQLWLVRRRQSAACFQAFRINNIYGALISAGLLADFAFR